jgi:hypothetical protein
MGDPRFMGNAQRRRMGAASSTLGMIPEGENYAGQAVKNHYINPDQSPASQSDSNGVGPEMAGMNQNLVDMDSTVNSQQFSGRPPASR